MDLVASYGNRTVVLLTSGRALLVSHSLVTIMLLRFGFSKVEILIPFCCGFTNIALVEVRDSGLSPLVGFQIGSSAFFQESLFLDCSS